LSQLDHERIVFFHDAFEKKNAVIMVMELYPPGCPLSSIHLSQVRSYMRQILEGICYLHQHSVLHLDIKPENLLMADLSSEQIRICDFGNAQELMSEEPQYCKYGTPEFVGPEIVNQTPVSSVTDIWPVGVIAYLCLTGISPFVGENDKTTLMNIRNYNVAFEERMFQGLTREAKGFVIKTLAKGKVISTDHLKLFLSRRKWQVKVGVTARRGPAGSAGGSPGARRRRRPHSPAFPPAFCGRRDSPPAGHTHPVNRVSADPGQNAGCISLPQPKPSLCFPDFPPIFHIKLKDQVLLEGEALTLCCLPAGSPTPRILWMKDSGLNVVSCKDGRQMLTIAKVSRKDAGLYECAAANILGTAISSCTLAVARKEAGGTSGDRAQVGHMDGDQLAQVT
uniref:Protein kinase domain-containing protein n=1 Tax=Malurus cyaneus samueli TaxID=2593467 RepID=A0A8C5UDS1_9PASS